MNFGNNIEKFGFDKGVWPLVEVSPDGNTIYMGKPPHENAGAHEKGWVIKKIIKTTEPNGLQIIETTYSDGGSWYDRYNLIFKFM